MPKFIGWSWLIARKLKIVYSTLKFCIEGSMPVACFLNDYGPLHRVDISIKLTTLFTNMANNRETKNEVTRHTYELWEIDWLFVLIVHFYFHVSKFLFGHSFEFNIIHMIY